MIKSNLIVIYFVKFIIDIIKKNTRVFSQTYRNHGDPRGRMRSQLICLIVVLSS